MIIGKISIFTNYRLTTPESVKHGKCMYTFSENPVTEFFFNLLDQILIFFLYENWEKKETP